MKTAMAKKIVAFVAIIALVAILGVFLVACSNQSDYVKRLEKAGYEVETKDDFDEEDKIVWAVAASKDDDFVYIYKYVSADDAKQAVKDMSGNFPGDNVNRNGALIICGTKQGVDDAKGTFG